MDASFNAPRAGPLTQLSAHIINFDAAVWLATDAFGWWKARCRSLSLVQVLSARKTSLVPTSSFSHARYREVRKLGTVVGLAAQNGRLHRLPGGVESSAVMNNAGIDCLRALTTGLLCFYSAQRTWDIIARIIPCGLLHSEQEDDDLEIRGPLLASLIDYVRFVAVEEDCNSFRAHLLQKTFQNGEQLGDSNFAPSSDDDGDNELGLLLGCLRWMVTPLDRRDLVKYPTRSIRVWTTMAVMSELGFAVSMFQEPVQTQEQYDEAFKTPTEDNSADVVLVTCGTGKTDPWVVTESVHQALELRPQVYPLHSLPYAAFGRLHRHYGLIDGAELTDIWQTSFRYAKSAVAMPTMTCQGKVILHPLSPNSRVHKDEHRMLISFWSPHLGLILGPAFDDYVPVELDGDWSPAAIAAFSEGQRTGRRTYIEDVPVMRNFYKLTAIILGTIYGACSKALTAQVPENETDPAGHEALEVAFSPDMLASKKPFEWAHRLGHALICKLDHIGWVNLIIELVAGIEPEQVINEQPSEDEAWRGMDRHGNRIPDVSDVVGVQANGVFAISDFVLRPTSRAINSLLFHIGTGRILDLPTDGGGYVRSSLRGRSVAALDLDSEPELDCLSVDSSGDVAGIRIGAEPDWRNDPGRVCFAVRHAGSLIGQLSIVYVLQTRLTYTKTCWCDKPRVEALVPRSEGWRSVGLRHLLQAGTPGVPKDAITFPDRNKVFVSDEVCCLYAVGILACRKLVICHCVLCGLYAVSQRDSYGRFESRNAALIIG